MVNEVGNKYRKCRWIVEVADTDTHITSMSELHVDITKGRFHMPIPLRNHRSHPYSNNGFQHRKMYFRYSSTRGTYYDCSTGVKNLNVLEIQYEDCLKSYEKSKPTDSSDECVSFWGGW
ncbi:hypothetical protein CBL_08172 [Carabus blaptoides fortunei]